MAGMKQLSAGSSQILMMMFRDKNNAPIKADSVHVKGSIFTGSSKPFEFEVNKGVCTNCKIQNDMLLFNIVPLLGLGQMQVYTQTFLGDAFQPMEFKKGDFIWLYAICNYNDGAYFMSVKNGQYLIQTIIEWEEIEESPVVPLGGVDGLRLMQAGKEVDKSLYNIEIDVDTNAIKVIKK